MWTCGGLIVEIRFKSVGICNNRTSHNLSSKLYYNVNVPNNGKRSVLLFWQQLHAFRQSRLLVSNLL